MSEDMITTYLECHYCTTRVNSIALDDKRILNRTCPQCKRDSLTIKNPFFMAGRFNAPLFSDWLLEKRRFVCLRDIGEVYYYDEGGGAWHDNGESFIADELAKTLGLLFVKKNLSEVIEVVKDTTHVERDVFGAANGVINLKNGVYDIAKHALMAHSPDYYFTYALPFSYDKDAKCPRFLKFLAEICENDLQEMISILEGFAYTFVPGYPIQKANMLIGEGSNGKGTLLNVLRAFVGEDNCAALKLQTITHEKTFALAKLYGKLLNIGPDLPSKELKDAGNFKAATGWDTIDADIKFSQRGVSFKNTAKMWFCANTIPESPEDTIAFYRRWNVWEFKHVFPEGHDILPALTTESEMAGIFNLVMESFYPVVSKNLKFTFSKTPEDTRWLYLRNSDTTKFFYEEACAYDREAETSKAEVYAAYESFCKHYNLTQKESNAFWRKLKDFANFEQFNHKVGLEIEKWVKGIKLVKAAWKDETASLEPARVAELYKNAIERYTGYTGILSLLNVVNENSVNDNNIGKNPTYPIHPEQEIPKNPRTEGVKATKNPKTALESLRIHKEGLILGHKFQYAPEPERAELQSAAQCGDIFEFKPGHWKYLDRGE